MLVELLETQSAGVNWGTKDFFQMLFVIYIHAEK